MRLLRERAQTLRDFLDQDIAIFRRPGGDGAVLDEEHIARIQIFPYARLSGTMDKDEMAAAGIA